MPCRLDKWFEVVWGVGAEDHLLEQVLSGLLERRPERRLGSSGAKDSTQGRAQAWGPGVYKGAEVAARCSALLA